jgi:hypothetical protein
MNNEPREVLCYYCNGNGCNRCHWDGTVIKDVSPDAPDEMDEQECHARSEAIEWGGMDVPS